MKKSVIIGGLIGAGVLFIILLAILMTGIFVIASLIVLLLAVIILLFVGFVIGGFIGFIAIKNKLKRRKWLILIIILVVVGIIISLYFLNPNVGQNWCTERKEFCPKIITPVCGCFVMRCEIPPCPETCRPFENSCFACLNHADYWTLGKCPECKKDHLYCEKDEDCICEQDKGCFMGNIKYYKLCVSNERKSTTSCQDVCAQQQCKCQDNRCDCGHGFA